jgi:dTDP-4-dehydrorhamnose 3,5-epimerase
MRFAPIDLAGAYAIHLEPRQDARGSFARAFCAQEFAARALETAFVQANISVNARAGTLRGLHFQRAPHEEVKLVRCVKGAVYDVIVDLRDGSPTFRQSFGTELSEANGLMLYVPKGFAHGYQALTDGATVFYMVSAFYAPENEAGLRYDDPKLAIRWPRPARDISDKDAQWPLLPP